MAVELEEKVMREIGLGNHYGWFNGSGSCAHIARNAVDKLASAMKENGLSLSKKWEKHCRKANQVDQFDGGNYSLTNTWIACSYAIEDGIYRSEGGKGFGPKEDWHFFYTEKSKQWQNRNSFLTTRALDVAKSGQRK